LFLAAGREYPPEESKRLGLGAGEIAAWK